MSNLNGNKYAAAIFATLLIGIGASEIAHLTFKDKLPDKPGYAVETGVATQAVAEGPVVVAITDAELSALLTAANVESGVKVARKCTACHAFEQGGQMRQGPPLWNVIGRKIAAYEGFKYSQAMSEQQGVWDYRKLYDYLEKPARNIPGTAMNFVGLRKQQDRINIMAWMRQQADKPASLP